MNNFKKLSLIYVVPVIVFLVFIFLQGFVFYFEYQQAQQKLYVEKEQYIKGITGNLQTRLSNSLMRLEKAHAQNIVLEAALDQNIKSIAVVDHNQQIVLSNSLRDKYMFAKLQIPLYDADLLPQVIEKNEFIFQYNQASQDLIVYAPVQMLSKGNTLNRKFNGLIFLRYSLKRAVTELRYESLYSLIEITLTLLISLVLLIYIINKIIIKPLTKITHSVALTDLASHGQMDETGIGEIGVLQHALADFSADIHTTMNALSHSEQRLAYALSAARDGVWDWNIAHDETYFSDRWKEMIGYKNDQIGDDIEEWESRIHENDLLLVLKELQLHIAGKNSFFESTHRLRCNNGEYRWVLCRGQTVSWDENGQPLRIIGTSTDISLYKQSQQQLSNQAKLTEFTQIPNRSQFLINLDKECIRAMHSNMHGAVIFIECDQYKTISDLQSYYQGEHLIFEIIERINEIKLAPDFIAHLNGSEFAILLPDLHHDREAAALMALQFTLTLDEAFKPALNIGKDPVLLSCVFGLELFPLVDESPNDILRHATMALKFTEEGHFNHISFFSKEIEQKVHARQDLQKQINFGLENNEFSLYFQPRVDVDGQLIGAETLIRWIDSAAGWVNPADFIPLAEECGLILPVGDWVISTALQQLAAWQEIGLPQTFKTLSLNVSSKQLLEDDFIATLTAHIERTKVDPSLVEIEISERILLSHKKLAIEKFNALRALGVHIAIDDFGNGYSAFSYLSVLPVTTLKLEQSFIENILQDNNQQVIVSTIISLVQALNLKVVAEGVESESQRQFLINQGCTQFQGYLVGMPMATQLFQTLLFKK